MRNIIYKIFCFNLIFSVAVTSLYAVKAVSSPVKFFRPDGSSVSVRIYGDEFFTYKKDMAGFLVELGSDGFLYYADYSSGELKLSGLRSSYIPPGVMKNIREKNILMKRDADELVKSGFSVIKKMYGAPGVPSRIETPVLLVEFADVKFTVAGPVQAFNSRLNETGYSVNGATGSAAEYLNDNFNGKCIFVFDVAPVVITLAKSKSYYGADEGGKVDSRMEELFSDVCNAAAANGVDFSKYDWFGEGKVRDVSIIYAGMSQAETGIPDDIWPQYHTVKNMSYNGKEIMAFSCSSELSAVGILKGEMAGIGTFCHEFAHSLGLPDMYDTNGENEGKGVGLWESLSIMDGGNYLNYGHTPPYFTAIERELLGYESAIPLPGGTYSTTPVHVGGEFFRIDSENKDEYFLIECRNRNKWDRYIGGEGMVVYHVDKSRLVYGGIPSYMRWNYNNINAFSQHQCAAVFPSSYSKDIELGHLFFPGVSSSTSLSSYGNTQFLDWNGQPLKVNISGISYKKGCLEFNAVEGQVYEASLPAPGSYKVIPYQYDCRVMWDIPPGTDLSGGKWRIRWKPSGNSPETVAAGEVFTASDYCYMTNVLPDTEYEVSVVFEKGNLYGREVRFYCSTIAVTSSMPYISIKGAYKVGEIADMRILNLTEQYETIKWYLNGELKNGDFYKFESAGDFTFKVVIRYAADGSEEIIIKKTRVY